MSLLLALSLTLYIYTYIYISIYLEDILHGAPGAEVAVDAQTRADVLKLMFCLLG